MRTDSSALPADMALRSVGHCGFVIAFAKIMPLVPHENLHFLFQLMDLTRFQAPPLDVVFRAESEARRAAKGAAQSSAGARGPRFVWSESARSLNSPFGKWR
jgi:hypothetical protein